MELSCYRCKTWPCKCNDGCAVIYGDAEAVLPRLSGIDLVFGSPPYCDARTYGIDAQRGCEEWVDWMLRVSLAAQQCCPGALLWVVGSVTRDRCYWPAPEGLMWKWWRQGGDCHLYRPAVFHRVGICGSGGDDWLRADWEYVVAMKRPGKLPWSDNTAAGHTPRWAPGGEMSHRLTDGQRRNQRGHSGTGHAGARRADGKRDKQFRPAHRFVNTRKRGKDGKRAAEGQHDQETPYTPPAKANPGNLLTGVEYLRQAQELLDQYERGDVRSGVVGGGHMGDDLAHQNEAPFPEWLAEVFVASFCPEGGTVLDPFAGSGSTIAVARKWGRKAIGIDMRESQCEIMAKRLRQPLLFA